MRRCIECSSSTALLSSLPSSAIFGRYFWMYHHGLPRSAGSAVGSGLSDCISPIGIRISRSQSRTNWQYRIHNVW
eukprot:7172400-Heterocapsa_arctica.AAC.1